VSMDIVDDLHAAEDLIGELRAALTTALTNDRIGQGPLRGPDRRTLVRLATEAYCRPTCGTNGEPHDDTDEQETCGCPCHPTQ